MEIVGRLNNQEIEALNRNVQAKYPVRAYMKDVELELARLVYKYPPGLSTSMEKQASLGGTCQMLRKPRTKEEGDC